MSRQPEDLSLGAGLIRKGEARGLSPALAAPPEPEDPAQATPALAPRAALAPAASPPAQEPAPAAAVIEDEPEPPLRPAPPDDVPKRFTSFRLPVDLDEDLRAMMFETRRSKQDLLIEFVTEGVKAWRRNRARRS
jgi:hypothetical protein